MTTSTVVHSPQPHRHIPGGDHMQVSYIGNAKVMIDESYIENRTQEQYERDYEQLVSAAWDIIDELVAIGEEV